jgi:hypothetical protein
VPVAAPDSVLEPLRQWRLLTDRSDPRCDFANKLGTRNRSGQRFVLDAEHVGDAGPEKQLPRQAQRPCLGPRFDVHYLKAVRRHKVKDFEQMGDHADDEACGRAVGDDNVRVFELVAVGSGWSKVGLSGKGVDGVGGAHEAGERCCPKRLVNGTGPLDEKDITGAGSLVGICVADGSLQSGDHVLGALVARSNNVSAMLVLLTAELLLDGFDHLRRMAAGAEHIEEVHGGKTVCVGSWSIWIGYSDPATASLEPIVLQHHVTEL